ncbi:PREDICTED: methionine--tRNA ligase, mitochondrial-like [Dufourea novaeangliae]|uniref:methionine--tRNA ligase, mitochondrial-like n=1 Tax=Dufourea novaeangliae TaxID=178035 RepID=UPI00076776A1|nr:PREDICTED: methionine--tRNA ligase, mitochondrial-like [Dufourea novaeangliae]
MAIPLRNVIQLSSLTFRKNVRIAAKGDSKRFIMTSRMRLEKVLEDLQKNPYFDKYAEKIAKLQKTSPDEFLQRVDNQAQKSREKKEKQQQGYKFYQSQAKPNLDPNYKPKQAQLSNIMKVDMIQDKTKEEIVNIWKNYHKQKDCISGILAPDQFDKMFERGKQYPTFLLPLPREHGYEFIVTQFYGTEVHMTPLLWYQAHKENSPECLSMVHYLELRESKGIVLMRGEFDKNTIGVQEAQCLANELQLYYCTDNPTRLHLLETFTSKPDEFKHMDLVAQLETIQLELNTNFLVAVHLARSCSTQSLWAFPSVKTKVHMSWAHIRKNCFSDNAATKVYITTPIFYVNAGPHIGHLYTAVLADAITRFNSMLGHSVFLCTGTDEHGTKVEKAANKATMPMPMYCTKVSQQFQQMCDAFQVDYSRFIRTTEKQHKEAVHHFWKILSDLELIEQKDTAGNVIRVSAESGNPVEWTEEDTYKFRLSSFQDNLKYWLKNENTVQPAIYHKILFNWIEEGLEDLSISRPVTRVPWAIPTPSDKSHTIYVWVDALVNYLTSIGYPDSSFKQFWPPTVQVVGKDILKFHGIYWPALLMAVGLEPPKKLLCHGHWTVNDQKMSKSKGNVISPFDAVVDFTSDGLRYFLLRQAVLHADANYNTKKIQNILNAELANTLGNLVNRCLGKSINPRRVIPDPSKCASVLKSEAAIENIKVLEEIGDRAREFYEEYCLHHVVDEVMSLLRAANIMFDHHKPWHLCKSKDLDSLKELEAVISLALESVRVAAIILQPIVPTLTSSLLDSLEVSKENRTWDDTRPLHVTNVSNRVERTVSQKMLLFKKIKD